MPDLKPLNSISIAFACDEKYAPHVAVVIQSICNTAQNGTNHEFHILTTDLSKASQNKFRELACVNRTYLEIHKLPIDLLSELPRTRHTLNAFLRLFLPDLLTNQEKVLYLDADILVLDSLQELWDSPLKQVLGAIPDATAYSRGIALKHFKALDLPVSHIYFNSGVLLFNLKRAREIDFFSQTISWIKQNSDLMVYSDQDALNAVFANQIAYLPLRWNLQVPLIKPVLLGWNCTEDQVDAVANPAIIHYSTARKPWCREYKLPFQKLYFYYLAQTPWNDSDFLSKYTFNQRINRLREEVNWNYYWCRSKVKRVLGKHSKPIKNFSLEVGTDC